MNKPFWKQGRAALKKTIRAVRGFKPEADAFHKNFAASLTAWDPGLEVLDWNFPIREGHSRIDLVALNSARELVFIWIQKRSDSPAIAKLLPDYDWIQKNRALWSHLFPQVLEAQSLRMMLWVFASEIDPEVKFLLRYLEGIRFRLFQARREKSRGPWRLTPWSELQKNLTKAPVLPSSPEVLSKFPAEPSPSHILESSGPLLTAEEINDLIRIQPLAETVNSEETTDPYYELPT